MVSMTVSRWAQPSTAGPDEDAEHDLDDGAGQPYGAKGVGDHRRQGDGGGDQGERRQRRVECMARPCQGRPNVQVRTYHRTIVHSDR